MIKVYTHPHNTHNTTPMHTRTHTHTRTHAHTHTHTRTRTHTHTHTHNSLMSYRPLSFFTFQITTTTTTATTAMMMPTTNSDTITPAAIPPAELSVFPEVGDREVTFVAHGGNSHGSHVGGVRVVPVSWESAVDENNRAYQVHSNGVGC